MNDTQKIVNLKKTLAKKGPVQPGDLMRATRTLPKSPTTKPLSKTIPDANTRVGVAIRGIF